jgi:predicted nucleic acid-binding protein
VSRVFWDTNIFIYLFEDDGTLGRRVRDLRERMNERGDTLVTSALTLGELQVKPLEAGQPDLAERYREVIGRAAEIIAFDREAAAVFASLRAGPRLKSPDAIQLACAAAARTDLFITNDARLSSVTVAGVQFVTSLERSPI